MSKSELKQLLINELHNRSHEKFVPDMFKSQKEYERFIEWNFARNFNILDDKRIRGIMFDTVVDILKENNIKFITHKVLIGYNLVREIVLETALQ